MGGAAASHFDAIADSLTKTLKDLSGPSTSTVADFLMSQVTSMLTEQRPQHAIEADVATAVLCLGYAAAHAPPAQLAPRATPILTTILAAAKSARGEALRGCAAKALELLAKVLCSHPNCAASCQAGTRDEAVELLLRFLSSSLRSAYDHKQQLRAARRLQLPALHASALLISLPPRPPPKTCATLVQGLLQILQADVLAARAPPEQGGPPNGATDFRPVDLQAVAEETYRHRQLMGVCHAVLGSLLALRGPPPTGLFPLLAALLPLALSSYPLLRFRTMEVAARLLQKQLASLAEGGPLPEATLEAAPESFGGAPKKSVLAAWHAFAAGHLGDSAASAAAADAVDVSEPSSATAAAEAASDPFSAAVGACLGLVLPRCSDPEARIRRSACSAAQSLLQLEMEGRSRIDEPIRSSFDEPLAESGRILARCADAAELESRVDAQRSLVPSLLALLPSSGIDALARSLIGGLDAEWSGAAAACVALNGLLPHANTAGSADFIASVLVSLLDVLPRIESQMVKNGALTVGASLAAADLDAVVRSLLTQPVPLGSAPIGLAQRIAREPALIPKLLYALTCTIADEDCAPHMQNKDAQSKANTATALVSAVAEEDPETLEAHRPAMIAALVLRFGSIGDGNQGGHKPEATACRATLSLLETIPEAIPEEEPPLSRVSADFGGAMTMVSEALGPLSGASPTPEDRGGSPAPRAASPEAAAAAAAASEVAALDPPQLVSAMRAGKLDPVVHARSLARLTFSPSAMRRQPPEPLATFDRLSTYATVRSDAVREVVVATLAELSLAARLDAAFTKQCIHLFLSGLVDECAAVRVQALNGVRHLAETRALRTHLTAEQFDTALSALAATLADANVAVGVSAFQALVPSLAAAHPAAVGVLLPQLSEHARAAAEHEEEPKLNAAGFETFAWLSRAAAEPERSAEERAAFGEHAHALLPLLLIHANHDDLQLRRSSLGALRALEPWFVLHEPILPANAPGAQPHALSGVEWLGAMAAALVTAQPTRLSKYIGCAARRVAIRRVTAAAAPPPVRYGSCESWQSDEPSTRGKGADPQVRTAAVLLTGALLARTAKSYNDGGEVRQHATDQLVAALSDGDVEVRKEAARSLGRLSG